MSTERRLTATFIVVATDGSEYEVNEFTTFDNQMFLGSNEPGVRNVQYVTADGTPLKAFLGGKDYLNERTGQFLKRK